MLDGIVSYTIYQRGALLYQNGCQSKKSQKFKITFILTGNVEDFLQFDLHAP